MLASYGGVDVEVRFCMDLLRRAHVVVVRKDLGMGWGWCVGTAASTVTGGGITPEGSFLYIQEITHI
jgi:hypothetical protein